MSDPKPSPSSVCESAKKILPLGWSTGELGTAPAGGGGGRRSAFPAAPGPPSPAGVAIANVERVPMPTSFGIADWGPFCGALWHPASASASRTADALMHTSLRRGRQTTGVSGPADSVPAVNSPSGEPREPEKRSARGAEQERPGERRERDRDLGALVAKDELGREVRIDLLQVRLGLRVEVLRARRLGDLPQRRLVELGARGPPFVPDERALRGPHAHRVHTDAQVRRPIDDAERRRALVVLAVGEQDDARGRELTLRKRLWRRLRRAAGQGLLARGLLIVGVAGRDVLPLEDRVERDDDRLAERRRSLRLEAIDGIDERRPVERWTHDDLRVVGERDDADADVVLREPLSLDEGLRGLLRRFHAVRLDVVGGHAPGHVDRQDHRPLDAGDLHEHGRPRDREDERGEPEEEQSGRDVATDAWSRPDRRPDHLQAR